MNDWVNGNPPYSIEAELEVKMSDGSMRTCKKIPAIDYGNLFFTDCTHAEQNAYCDRKKIISWRVCEARKRKEEGK